MEMRSKGPTVQRLDDDVEHGIDVTHRRSLDRRRFDRRVVGSSWASGRRQILVSSVPREIRRRSTVLVQSLKFRMTMIESFGVDIEQQQRVGGGLSTV
jgi:hypothetical protein